MTDLPPDAKPPIKGGVKKKRTPAVQAIVVLLVLGLLWVVGKGLIYLWHLPAGSQ
jgi:hypothetical protein